MVARSSGTIPIPTIDSIILQDTKLNEWTDYLRDYESIPQQPDIVDFETAKNGIVQSAGRMDLVRRSVESGFIKQNELINKLNLFGSQVEDIL